MDYIFPGKILVKVLLKLATTVTGFVIIITFGCSIFFGLRALAFYQKSPHHVQQQKDEEETEYDKRQDDRMDAADERAIAAEAARQQRIIDSKERQSNYYTKIDEDHDRIVRDEAYFAGAMAILGLLQLYLKLNSQLKPNTRRDRNDGD